MDEFNDQIDAVYEQLRQIGCSEEIIDKVCDVITGFSFVKIMIPTIQKSGDKYGIRWDTVKGYLSVLFSTTSDEWEWDYFYNNGRHIVRMEHNGMPDVNGSHKYYYLPDAVQELIKLPDEFSKTYSPLIEPFFIKKVWETDYYDGFLAGYVRVRGKLCFAEAVEEYMN
jgi:hypothetical protein